MAGPIGSIDGSGRVRRLRRRRKDRAADETAAAGAVEPPHPAAEAAPIPPLDPASPDGPPAISAQLMGQSGPAEGAGPAKSAARQAQSAYLKVEWSGRYDRRTRRGRIAKTEV